jgi:hypothetical protein
MNTSYSKIRHIQESNIILESRRNDSLINESQNILPPIKSNTLVPPNNSIMLSNNHIGLNTF